MKKISSVLSIFLAALLLLGACSVDTLSLPEDVVEVNSASGGSSTPAPTHPVEVNLLYTSDTHGRLVADEETIGIDHVAGLLAATENAILVDGGDFLHGSPFATLSEGETVVRLMKEAGYLAAAVGNHEFSYDMDVLQQRLQQAAEAPNPMPFLSANVYGPDGELLFTPWLVQEVAGVQVGLFGLTTTDTAHQGTPGVVGPLTFEDPIAAAQRCVEELEAEGCQIIVALAHIGSDEGQAVRSMDLAEEVEGLAAVIDAHSHVVLDEVAENGVPVVAAGEYGQQVGKLTLTWDPDAGAVSGSENRLYGKAEMEAFTDEAIAKEIADIEAANSELLDVVIGNTPVDLDGEKELVRTVETNLGNLVADALLDASGADIALMNGGCIRASIPTGDITMGQLLAAFPYSNVVVTKEVTGAQLREILEHALGMLPEADGRFAQLGGVMIWITQSAPVGERIMQMRTMDGAEIEDDKTYLLATNDFVAAGGDDYPVLADLPELFIGATVEEAVRAYLGTADLMRYAPSLPQRIQYW